MKGRTEIVERERWHITSGMRIQSFLALVVIATLTVVCASNSPDATTKFQCYFQLPSAESTYECGNPYSLAFS